jgi:AraC family transcriptional regulator, transcriptional activator of pobA
MDHFKTLGDLHGALGYPPPENPLLSLVTCNGTCTNPGILHTSDFYTIGFKKMKSGVMRYGKTKYDHDRGSMSFIAPRQIVGVRDLKLEENGFLIYFHEDLLNGHPLHSEIKKYSFFEYEINEALHLSPAEEKTIWDIYNRMQVEYHNNQDDYSKDILLSHINSILKYAQRFYKRQFINRTVLSGNTVSKFNGMLESYFQRGLVKDKGLPTVNFIASELNLSPRYLSDLLKQETGKTAIDLIHIFLIAEAKNLLTAAPQSVSEVAYGLGFENPPYFSRLFRKEVGMSPGAFKKLHLN